jgi:YHS domain-containing protein
MPQVKDPVCGMMVEDSGTETSEYNGKKYYFCSKDCKREFDENPGEYAGTA